MNKRRFIFVFPVLFYFSLCSNNLFTNYTVENGLPHSLITNVIQDRKGFIWVTTPKGVTRFDGKTFKVFGREDGINASMDLDIICTAYDNQNNLWFGTSLGGLLKYDGRRFTQFTKKQGLLHNQIWSLYYDSLTDNLWIGTLKGLNILKDGKISVFEGNMQLPDQQIRSIYKTGNCIWLGTYNGGIVAFEGGKARIYDDSNGFSLSTVTSICPDHVGDIWVSTRNELFKYSAGSFSNVTKKMKLPQQVSISAITFDIYSNLWIGTRNELYKYANDSTEIFNSDDGLASDYITSIFSDSEGDVWIGTVGGLTVYRKSHFSVYDKRHGIVKGSINSVVKDANNDLWLAVNGFGVLKQKDGAFQNMTAYDPKFRNLNARHILISHEGKIWASCFRQGVLFSDNGGKTFNEVLYEATGMNPGSIIFTKAFEDSENRIWFATFGMGVFVLDKGKIKRYASDEIRDNGVNYIAEAPGGNIWIATNSGLSRYLNGKITNYGSAQLPDTICKTITFAGEDMIVGTTNGLMIIRKGAAQSFPEKQNIEKIVLNTESFEKNDVNSAWLDARHNLWLGTFYGLYKFDLPLYSKKGKIVLTHFDQKDGLEKISINSTFAEKNGKIFVGCSGNLVSFDPNEEVTGGFVPKIYLNDLKLFLEKTDWKKYDDSVNKFNGLPLNLSLPYNLNHLQFSFIGLSYSRPSKIKYKYKLEGFDKTWSPETGETDIIYSNIPAGEYNFLVTASSSDAGWSQPASFHFFIRPPFWRTSWFLALACCAFVFSLFLYIRLKTGQQKRLNRILEKTITIRTTQLNEEKHKLETANGQLKLAKERAEESEKVKEQFLANMSHEIRTPMNAIVGMSNLLLGTPLEEKQKYYMDAIKRSGDNLMVIINDILDFSKINAGKIQIENISFSPAELVQGLRNTFEFAVKEKNIQLHFDCSKIENIMVSGDPYRLNQVLINLIGNAVKFTGEGSVKVSSESKTTPDGKIILLFSVSDTGIGIPADKLGQIFDSFSQAASDTTRRFGGTGLGLTICRQLTELMGGTLSVNSKLNEGTTFQIEIPFNPANAEKVNAHPQQVQVLPVKLKSILLAEDNLFNQTVAEDTLRILFPGVEIVIASNGQEAINKLSAGEFDMVLMDIQMPVMDGIEATSSIRRMGGAKSNIPLIALTASATHDEVKKYEACGINGFVLKPFQPDALRNEIIRVLTSLVPNKAAQTKILIVDDNEFNRVIAADTISTFLENCSIDFASSGSEAISKNISCSYQLIIMDIQMPGMDGYEASEKISETNSSTGKKVPVIALTAYSNSEEAGKAAKVGIACMLPKPFEPQQLKEAIFRILNIFSTQN